MTANIGALSPTLISAIAFGTKVRCPIRLLPLGSIAAAEPALPNVRQVVGRGVRGPVLLFCR